MSSFISETLDAILQEHPDCKNTVLILPSQRAGVFVKNALKSKLSKGFLPEILNIEQFIEQISEIRKVDAIQLLFQFYSVYKKLESEPDSFDVFSSWAITAIQDFNEIDQYLVDSRDLFLYVRDIQRLRKWSVKGEFKETEMVKDHYAFLERLGEYYNTFYHFLKEQKIGYQGLLYRESCQNVDRYLDKNSNKHYAFIGFNALNTAEEKLFQHFLNFGDAKIYWDLDASYLENNHQASHFIRKYLNSWTYYEKNPKPHFSSHFNTPKNIQVIGTAKSVMQIKVAGTVLNNIPSFSNSAMILGDESLLTVALNSIPKKENGINVTMGYPLKEIPNSHLIRALFQLYLNQEKLNKKEVNLFYFKDVLQLLKDGSFQKIAVEDLQVLFHIEQTITTNNLTFISFEFLESFFKDTQLSFKENFLAVFKPLENISDFLDRVISLLLVIKKDVHELEKEYLFRFYSAFLQLQNLNNTYQYFTDLKTLYRFYNQILSNETLSFQGEPLQGLQLMGMLETRVLDFENIILTSVNEGVLPTASQQNSFIPFDVKVHYNLPTYKEKDAIYSYHFFRLLQRAKNIYLIYNTENDSYGNGEKSRFISQLELLRNDLKYSFVNPNVIASEQNLNSIEKTPEIINKLKAIASSGFSPSFIGSYLLNPIGFYQNYVLDIKELNDVEETIAANTLGTIVHNTLEELYKPYIGKFLTLDALKDIRSKSTKELNNQFKREFKSGDYSTGKNKLIYEVSKQYVVKLIELDKEIVEGNHQLKIVALEHNLKADLTINGLDFPIKIKGQADRIDELNGTPRIIDYKTGKVVASDLKLPEDVDLNDYKFAKAIQVMLYAYMFTKSEYYKNQPKILGGIYSFKNLKEKFISMDFSAQRSRKKDTSITSERLEMFLSQFSEIIKEIFDVNIPLTEKESPFKK